MPANFDVRIWLFWLDLVGEINNDSIKTHFLPDLLEHGKSLGFSGTLDYYQKNSKFDISLIFTAIEKLEEQYGSKITIYYMW